MKRKQAVLVVSIFILLTAALATAATVDNLDQKAVQAMRDGEFDKARDLLLEALEMRPGDKRLLYNLACCASLSGDLEEGEIRLLEAWDSGLRDLDLIQTDPDLAALRSSRGGSKLIKQIKEAAEEELRRFGSPLLFEGPVLATSRVIPPPEVKNGEAYPLVVLLHGHGGTADIMVGMFNAAGLSPSYVVLAPYGPHPIPVAERIGYSWFPPVWLYNEVLRGFDRGEGRAREIQRLNQREQEISEAYVLASIDRALESLPVDPDRIFLLGHSEGGVLGYGLALRHPDRFRGLVVVGSRMRGVDAEGALLEQAAGNLKVLVCHSPDDEAISIEEGKKAYRTLREAGVSTELVRYSGGHSMTVDLIHTITEWIGKTAKKSRASLR